jgi:flagellar basal-body rod modification protein FlgD
MTLLSGLGSASGITTASDQARTQLAGNFDTFLTLLTTQLQNQDPLEPMDSSKFTEQLVQYSQVEQQIQTNAQLKSLSETLTQQIQATSAGTALSFIGRTAEFNSGAMRLGEEGDASWNYILASGAANVTLTIKDADGKIVYEQSGELAPGRHEFTWDGETVNGVRLPEGVYHLSVTAKDASGETIESGVTVTEIITGVDLSSADASVVTASGARDFTSILRITNPDA